MNLEEDEVVLEEHKVKYGNTPSTLVVTNKRLLFLKKKGIIIKKDKVFKNFKIDQFKVYKDSVQMKQKMLKIFIQSSEGNIEFTCENVVVAKAIYEKISSLRLGDNYLKRTSKKVKKLMVIY